MAEIKELTPQELIRQMVKSPGWQIYEDEIKNRIGALETELDNEDFETLAEMEKVRGEKRGLKQTLAIVEDLAINEESEEEQK